MLDFHHSPLGMLPFQHKLYYFNWAQQIAERVGCNESKENFLKFSSENFPNLKLLRVGSSIQAKYHGKE